MKKTPLVSLAALGLTLLSVGSAFSQAAFNPTPTRESKLLVAFEDQTTVTADPNGAGENRASINTDPKFAAEGAKSLKLDLTGIGAWHDNWFQIDFPQPIDIAGHQVLSMDVFVPLESLDNGVPAGGWFQFSPRTVTTNPGDDTATTTSYYDNRDLVAGWNHLIWDLRNGTDTKIKQLFFAGNTNGDKPYSGPIYVDNIRVYKGTFHGIKPDEKLILGFDNAADKDFFTPADEVEVTVNTDAQFVRDGAGSLKVDLTDQGGGWTNNIVRADDFGATLDVTKATAIHLDIFVPEGNQPEGWRQLGFVVIGEGGEAGTAALGFVPGQWNTLEITLTPEQAQALGKVKGLYFLRNQDSNTPWRGPFYADNLRAVIPAQ